MHQKLTTACQGKEIKQGEYIRNDRVDFGCSKKLENASERLKYPEGGRALGHVEVMYWICLLWNGYSA